MHALLAGMVRSRRIRLLIACLTPTLWGCGGSDTGPTGPGAPIGGIWTYFGMFGNAQLQVTCNAAGTLDVVQSDTRFTATANQTGGCVAPGGSIDNSGTETLSGTVSSTAIEFSVAGCAHKGQLFGNPVDSAAGTIDCQIQNGVQVIRLSGIWFAVKGLDLDAPTVAATVSFPQGDTVLVPGDVLTIALTASDDRKVLWVGYRLGPPANAGDSVRVAAKEHSTTFSISASTSLGGGSPLTIFARDALDRTFELSAGTLRVIDAIRRPLQTVPLGGMFTIATDIVYDPKRNALYLFEGEEGQIAVLALGSFTFGSPLPLPGSLPAARRAEMDITPGGDSLVMPIANTSIGFVNLVTGATSTVPIVSDVGSTQFIGESHTVANRKVFVFGTWSDVGTSAEALWEYDLATGVQRRRTDVGIGGNILSSGLARSHDHQKLLLLDVNRNCGQVYDATAQTFSACVTMGFPEPATLTGTTTGDRWLVGNLVLDGALNVIATLPSRFSRGTISVDGTAAYYPTEYGYVKIRLPDGAEIERVRIPTKATRVTALPDGQRIVIWSDPGATSQLLTTNRVTVVNVQ